MTVLTVALGARSYPIHLTDELPATRVAAEAERVCAGRDDAVAVIVTDSNVGPLYAADVADGLRARGLRAPVLELPAGEATKSWATVGAVTDFALDHRASRRDQLVALGGGVVGDITGFAASVLHRGVPFIQVPTTLLAQVDSSVGGKTGVNHPAGKNLLGAFWQPRAVVASHPVLKTLPDREQRCGLAEALKHGFIASATLVDWIADNAAAIAALDATETLELVAACCRIKASVVAEDERDTGRRAILNFGHTFGHAYERLLGYGRLTHGEAVALGMVQAARLSEALGVAAAGTVAPAIVRALSAIGLPADPDDPALPELAALVDAARTDKKAYGDSVDFVLLPRIGEALIRTLHWVDITRALRSLTGGPHEEVE